MTFRVTVSLGFVDGSGMDLEEPFSVEGTSEDDMRSKVTPDFIMKNVSDDWGPPIETVRILKISKVR